MAGRLQSGRKAVLQSVESIAICEARAARRVSAMSTILIVDDDLTNRTMFSMMLEHEGYRVLTAGDAPSALELLAAGAQPTLILLDLMMPGMSGWDFRRIQLQDPRLAHIPVVVLSAMNDLISRSDGLDVAEVLQKPVTIAMLLETVGRYCPPPARA